jgi:hypothetical protein
MPRRGRPVRAPSSRPFRIRRHGRSAALRRTGYVLNGRRVEVVEDAQGIAEVSEVRG